MPGEEFAWECECGHIEYSNIVPSDCPKCLAIGAFTQLPEEIMNEREKDKLEDADLEMENSMKAPKLKSPKSPKIKKPGKAKRKRK